MYTLIPLNPEGMRKGIARWGEIDSNRVMIKGGFLTEDERKGLLAQVRLPSGAHGPARRAHAILLLDDGMSAPDVARVMSVDDDTVYQWHRLWDEGGAVRLSEFGWKGSSPRLSLAQDAELVEALTERLYTTTAEVIGLVEARFGVTCTRSGMIKLLARFGFEYRKPKALPRLPSVAAQSVTHNKFYPAFHDFAEAVRAFFRDALPSRWERIRDFVSDTFPIINRDDFRVLA